MYAERKDVTMHSFLYIFILLYMHIGCLQLHYCKDVLYINTPGTVLAVYLY